MTKKISQYFTIFTLILEVLAPGLVIAADHGYSLANSSVNYISTTETTISEDPGARLLNVEPKPDAIYKGVITAYTSTPDQTDDTPFHGARGTHVYDGMIAVNGLPFDTKIKIPALYGDKIFTVDDRMNRRYSCRKNHCRADIWLDTTKSEARKFGVKRVDIEIYYPSKKMALVK
ncbi:MAG: hypothetical protein Q7K39_03150 [Candidatus Magasanikbacteria bacterium]|nr:hypothetical protein [Candidatus Magasanikbacteria bacterium]